MSNRKSPWRRVVALVRPYRWRLGQSLALLLVLTGMGLLLPIFAGWIVHALEYRDMDMFLLAALLLLGTQVTTAYIGLINSHLMRVLGGRVVFDLRRKMFTHLQRLSLSFYESRGAGEIMSRMMNDVAAITTLITGTALNTIVSLCNAAAILVMLFYLNWKVALLALTVMPVHFVSYHLFRRRLGYQSWKASEKTSQIYGKANEVFDAAKMVKAHGSQQREIRTLTTQLREGYEIEVQSGLLSNIWGWGTNMVANAGTIMVTIVCGAAVILTAELTLGQYTTLLLYVGMLYAPINQLIAVANQLIPAKVGMQRVFEILDMQPEVEDRTNALRRTLDGQVSFERVGFAYPNGKQVLTNITFTAEAGQTIALVGPSGSGKTTIANLIARFYDRTGGAIRLDGIDIQDYALASLRQQMSIVLQETFLFRGTIRENLQYGKPGATAEQLEHAARQANAHEFIRALPDGYDSIVGNRGARLSGGQRQRLAIARALIRDPKILILDEATSALDTASEAKVKDALEMLMRDRTTFIIAHRLSTIRHADRILVMDTGRIVQSGTHDELIDQEGLYRKLYDPDWAKEQEKREEAELFALAAVA
jgi:ABC-type multidrug transport system fused ATPase/permease subunit